MSKTRLAIGTSLTALTFGMLAAGTAYAYQEQVFNARNDLQQAINELKAAVYDQGGHREQPRYSGGRGPAMTAEPITVPTW